VSDTFLNRDRVDDVLPAEAMVVTAKDLYDA